MHRAFKYRLILRLGRSLRGSAFSTEKALTQSNRVENNKVREES